MVDKIKSAIESQLNIHHIEIIDQSAQHAGHSGNTGGGHYNAYIISDDFMDKTNMGDVQSGTGCGASNPTWENAPLITLKGKKLKAFDPVKDSMERAT